MELQIEYAPLDEIRKYKNNAKEHPEKQIEQIAESIENFGFNDPIGVWQNEIVEGHGRYEAAKKLGLETVPIIRLDHMSDKDRKIYILAHNKLTLNTGFDLESLAIEMEDLQSLDANLELTGFSAAEIDDLFSQVHDKDIEEDEFDVDAALEEEPVSKLGDLWELGPHRLLCGDSTSEESYTRLMDGKQANLVVTDPPYGVNYHGSSGQGTIQNDNMQEEEFYTFLLESFGGMETVMANDASIYVFHADTKGLIFRSAFGDAGFYLSGVCQWVKQALVLGRSPYQWQNEPILFGWKRKGKHKWYAGRSETTVWNFDRPSSSKLHPTMKPVALIAYPIKNSSAVNSIVLDPFSGSGSTIIASDQLDRVGYAIELDPKYVDVGVKRYIEHVGSDAEVFLLRDGEKIAYAEVVGALV